MSGIRLRTRVFVSTGYMDCQGRLQGFVGQVIGRAGRRWLVRDEEGRLSYHAGDELQPLPPAVA